MTTATLEKTTATEAFATAFYDVTVGDIRDSMQQYGMDRAYLTDAIRDHFAHWAGLDLKCVDEWNALDADEAWEKLTDESVSTWDTITCVTLVERIHRWDDEVESTGNGWPLKVHQGLTIDPTVDYDALVYGDE